MLRSKLDVRSGRRLRLRHHFSNYLGAADSGSRDGLRFGRHGTAQAMVGFLVLIAGFDSANANWPGTIGLLTGLFAMLWLVSAWLFRRAAREQTLATVAR